MFLISNSAKDLMLVKCMPTSYRNPLYLQPEVKRGMTEEESAPSLLLDDVSTSATPSGKQAVAAHCKVFSGCCWERLCSPKQKDEWIPQLHPALGLQRLLLFSIKSNLHFSNKTLELLGVFHSAFLCIRPKPTELYFITWRSYEEILNEF